MLGLGVMMANGIACGAGRVAAGLALSLSADDIISLDGRFHGTLYAPARRERTLSIIVTLRFKFERYFRFAWEEETSHLERSQRDHREILKCCRSRNTEKAGALLRKHILGSGTPLLRRLKELDTGADSGAPAR